MRKLYITHFKTGFTYYGEVSSFTENAGEIKAVLQHVDVYEYTSSNYLHAIPEIKLSGPKEDFHIETPA
jgi:hypothetical protein